MATDLGSWLTVSFQKTDFISEEEEKILTKAMQILEQIGDNTKQWDAVKYYNQIINAEKK